MAVIESTRTDPVQNKREARVSRIAVHAIQTGVVRVRRNQVQGSGSGAMRLARTFFGREWSSWLPIHAWLIEHPEGPILVDTGETARVAEPGYFPGWHLYYRRGLEMRVTPDQEIDAQLAKRGYSPRDIRRVVMTHLHTDHAGGLRHFPDSEIIIARGEHERASGIPGRLRGYLPNRMPDWLEPTLVDLTDDPFGPFPASWPVTDDGAVTIVSTPGHTPDHLSVVVDDGALLYFVAGDASYNEQLMIDGAIDGIAPDDGTARATLARIRELACSRPMIYLPAHDPDAALRLVNMETVEQ
jgi:glyoxylase-like metal-dependent hydrolase (beta-lactamase superfamily II)